MNVMLVEATSYDLRTLLAAIRHIFHFTAFILQP